jgi:hypothetical protein
MTRRALRIVEPSPAPASEIIDITAGLRADIAARDWKRCHIEGDRNPPLDIPDLPKRKGWRA